MEKPSKPQNLDQFLRQEVTNTLHLPQLLFLTRHLNLLLIQLLLQVIILSIVSGGGGVLFR